MGTFFMVEATSEFHRPFDLEGLGQAGRIVRIDARAKECEALARRLGLVSLEALGGDLELRRLGGGIYEVTGRFTARISQNCVVSLEAFDSTLEGDFEQRYVVGGAGAEDSDLLDPEGDEPPEVLEESTLDLGEAMTQELAIKLDPHPRRPGANLDQSEFGPRIAVEEEGERANPFADLARLVKGSKSEP
jgi:uncharacterized metal-binding protein YceD (DUF177 family)